MANAVLQAPKVDVILLFGSLETMLRPGVYAFFYSEPQILTFAAAEDFELFAINTMTAFIIQNFPREKFEDLKRTVEAYAIQKERIVDLKDHEVALVFTIR